MRLTGAVTLLDHLRGLDADGLADLLRARPDVLWLPEPRGLRELAQRLAETDGVAAALLGLPLPAAQLCEALSALGSRAALPELAELLGVASDDAGLTATLALLARHAVAWREGTDEQHVVGSSGVLGTFTSPLGLHLPLRDLLEQRTAAQLHAQARALGGSSAASKSRAAAEAAIRAVLLDPDQVRALAAGAPPEVQEWLSSRFGTREDPAPEHGYRRAHPAERWALEHGLGVPPLWGADAVLPREVAMALRPAGSVAPFAGSPPEVPTSPVDPAAVASAGAAATVELVAATTAVLDDVAQTPTAQLRSGDGGVGVREIKRLVKAVGASEEHVRLALELGHELGLLDDGHGYADVLVLSELGVRWREEEPLERALSLVEAWVRLGRVATPPPISGKAQPALQRVWAHDDLALQIARTSLLEALATLPEGAGTTAASVARRVRWASPALARDPHLLRHWREAELLGLVALGAVTPLGRAVAAADRGAAEAALAGALPRTADEVLLGSDLTAVVAGDPSARVSALLDSCADREGRGGAVVWRLSPGSVRRALDTGTPAAALLADLEDVVVGGVPQAVEFLVKDVARSHGALRVRAAVSLVRCDDEPLLAQAVADRALRSLGLSLVAPTVASATAAPDAVVAAMRKAGYLPMPEDARGVVVVAQPRGAAAREERESERALRRKEFESTQRLAQELGVTIHTRDGTFVGGPPPPEPEPLDLDALASRLLTGAAQVSGPEAGEVERAVGSAAPHLSPPQVHLLGRAVTDGGSVELDCVTVTGAQSTRVVSDLALVGTSLHCWCHVAQAPRVVRLDRVRAVRPAAG